MTDRIELTKINLLIFSSLITVVSSGQFAPVLPRFSPPMDIPISLSGNFMELRNDHFHSGLDMRTESKEGIPVKAAGDGWVSRIKVSPWGYGKALYIDHPNGYTTVYGHLRNYSGTIAGAALDGQYKAKAFEVDLTFSPGELAVKKGQVVANSGNTGGSSGPHLHFEVRRTNDQHALDPERFGMDIPDSVSPSFLGLRIDPLDSSSRAQPYPAKARGYVLTGKDGAYTIKGDLTPMAFGTVGLSVNVIDRYSNSGSTCGIRGLKVSVDGVATFSADLDEINFDLQRYANAFMDYGLFKGNDMNYNRCYKLPNNKLELYGNETAQGRLSLVPGRAYKILVEAIDANGNRSVFPFTLLGATSQEAAQWPKSLEAGQLFTYNTENSINTPEFRFVLPANSLYANERISWKSGPSKEPFAPTLALHDKLTPLHIAGQLAIKVDAVASKGRESKLLVVKFDEKGQPSPVGGVYTDGWVTAKVRGFGDYSVMIDTIPPKVTAFDLVPVMTGRDSLRIQVTDNLSGIDKYVGRLDGEWILFEFDQKRKQLIHTFDKHSSGKGNHQLELVVSDERGNTTTLKADFLH